MDSSLIKKYNIPGPRYTSYPTVPYWENNPSENDWITSVRKALAYSNAKEGISLYIHLPYCESLCTYCGCNTRITVNHAVEKTYIAALLKEWSLYLGIFTSPPCIREIHLGGGTPTFFSPENLRHLIQQLTASSLPHEKAEFSFEAHPNNTTPDHLQTLFGLGFRRLSLGIQDFDPRVQEIVNRIQPFENVERVTTAARSLGYTSINFDLIYGLPLQNKKSVTGTIEKVKLLRPDRIAFYSYAHVPWIKPGQRKFTEKDLPEDDEKRELYETGRAMLLEAGYHEIGMDHFALPTDSLFLAGKNKTLHRNFMGYTHSYTQLLIGLGASSISDTGEAFAQNSKTVEDYSRRVYDERFPFFRGHALNDRDLIIRRHILNIMCRQETSWTHAAMQTDAVYDAIERLKEMENDGLVEIRPFQLKVTTKGIPFIRNVCMAFDERLWKNVPQTQLFSKTI